MNIRFIHVVIGVLAFNFSLIALTFGLSKHAEMQNPMQGSLIDVNGIDMHVVKSMPDGYEKSIDSRIDALVLIHGASTSALDFVDNLLPELSIRYPVVALDRPGHGYSERGDHSNMDDPSQQAKLILDTLAAMQISSPVLIGHSWAGSAVLAGLLTQHESVKPAGGVLIAGVTHPYEREDSTPTKMALAPYYGPIFRWQYLSPIGRLAVAPTVERFFAPDAVPENYIQETGLYLTLRPNAYLHNALDRSRLTDHLIDQSKGYGEITTPLLSIAATEDQVVPPSDHHVKLINEVDGAQAVEISGAGHSPHHTRTDEVLQAIETFLAGLD